MVFNPFLHFQACFGLHVFLGCVIELSVEMANFLIDVFESPEDFEVIFNTLATSTSSRELKELGKMFKELLESLRRELSRSRRKEGVEKLRRLIESWKGSWGEKNKQIVL